MVCPGAYSMICRYQDTSAVNRGMERKLTDNNEISGRRLPKKDPSTPFVKDMEPYFYGRHITYVDVGAYRGDVLETLVRSRIRVREAHLLEPNPQSFDRLEEQMAQVKAV